MVKCKEIPMRFAQFKHILSFDNVENLLIPSFSCEDLRVFIDLPIQEIEFLWV